VPKKWQLINNSQDKSNVAGHNIVFRIFGKCRVVGGGSRQSFLFAIDMDQQEIDFYIQDDRSSFRYYGQDIGFKNTMWWVCAYVLLLNTH
jgi:hypothetical protein